MNGKTAQAYITRYTEEYIGKIFYFCLKKTDKEQEAEELTSDISLCVLNELERGVIPEYFSGWVWRIAKNRYSVWADKKRRKTTLFSGSDISDFELTDSKSAENEYVRNEELSLLRRELAFISSDYRTIVAAYYIDDKPVRDIAAALGLTEGTVKMRLLRARKILKEGMNMAREFGIKSYNPEEITFAASGSQSSGLPWSAVQRKIPKNILLQASNNPSTVEELAVELGIAVPYIEEEVEILVNSDLLKKIAGNKFVTNFFIADKNSQLNMYNAQRLNSKERSRIIDVIADDLISEVRTLGIVRNEMSDNDIKWWLVIHIIDYCVEELSEYNINSPLKHKNADTWGFIGFEKAELPENCTMGHNGNGSENAMFWSYKISDYNMWDRAGELNYTETLLLADFIKNKRKITTLTESEKRIWQRIKGKFAHTNDNNEIIPDILIFENNAMEKTNETIQKHYLYSDLMQNISDAFNGTLEILKKSSIEILRDQLIYCASMQILQIRMMTIHDEVENSGLALPEIPEQSTTAMWLEIK